MGEMRQYCRYCAFCIEGDCFYCTDKDMVLSKKKIRRVNHCKGFALSDIGDVITGRKYTPRKGKPLAAYGEGEQMELRFL